MPRINYRKVFDKIPGNYVVAEDVETTEGDMRTEYYAGESEDVFRRLHEHTSVGRRLVALLVNWGGKESRLEVEREMIESLDDGSGDVQNKKRKKGRGK